MRPLSASEAIGPALERTRDLLFRPFRLRTFFKVAAVAFFAEMGGGLNSNFSHGTGNAGHGLPPSVLAFLVAFAVIIGLISLVIGLVLFYVGSRLQLVLVELVASRQTYVSPMWRRLGSATWRWIGLKILFFLGVLLLSLPFTIPLIFYFIHHIHDFSAGSFFSGMHIAEIVLFIAAACVALIAIAVTYTLVRDLALPSLALEDASISESLRRLRALVNAEPGQICLYVFLRLVLGFVFGLGAEIAMAIVLFLSLIPPGIIGLILWLALHNAGTGGTVALVGLAIVGGLIYLCWAICVIICFIGAALAFNQAYALCFLGGRYPLLGDLLDRSAPPPEFAYTPGFPPPPANYPPQPGPPPAPLTP
jgi:hypothetical protein